MMASVHPKAQCDLVSTIDVASASDALTEQVPPAARDNSPRPTTVIASPRAATLPPQRPAGEYPRMQIISSAHVLPMMSSDSGSDNNFDARHLLITGAKR
jgi:hypothetical protein